MFPVARIAISCYFHFALFLNVRDRCGISLSLDCAKKTPRPARIEKCRTLAGRPRKLPTPSAPGKSQRYAEPMKKPGLLNKSAGWKQTQDGSWRWWNGHIYTDIQPPNNNHESAPGWYAWSDGIERWWNLHKQWSNAYRSSTGKIDVANDVGQGIIHIDSSSTGGNPAHAFKQRLALYPPCEIVSFEVMKSPVAIAFEVFAVVQWG